MGNNADYGIEIIQQLNRNYRPTPILKLNINKY